MNRNSDIFEGKPGVPSSPADDGLRPETTDSFGKRLGSLEYRARIDLVPRALEQTGLFRRASMLQLKVVTKGAVMGRDPHECDIR